MLRLLIFTILICPAVWQTPVFWQSAECRRYSGLVFRFPSQIRLKEKALSGQTGGKSHRLLDRYLSVRFYSLSFHTRIPFLLRSALPLMFSYKAREAPRQPDGSQQGSLVLPGAVPESQGEPGGQGDRRRRFVLVFNPEQAKKDKATRDKTLKKIEETIKALGDPSGAGHKRAVCALLSHRTMGRFVRQTKTGKLRINQAKVQEEKALDGKYLLSTSDDTLSAEDVALGYKQLMEVERAFPDAEDDT